MISVNMSKVSLVEKRERKRQAIKLLLEEFLEIIERTIRMPLPKYAVISQRRFILWLTAVFYDIYISTFLYFKICI